MRTQEEIVRETNNLPKNGLGRIFPKELKQEIVAMYSTLERGSRTKFTDSIGINQNVIPRWNRNRNEERKASTIRRKKQKAEAKALRVNSSAGKNSRTIGTNLSTILANMKDNDILQQVTMVDTLEEAGYKREAVIEKIDSPSMEDLTKIMDAVKLLSEQYTITKKETK